MLHYTVTYRIFERMSWLTKLKKTVKSPGKIRNFKNNKKLYLNCKELLFHDEINMVSGFCDFPENFIQRLIVTDGLDKTVKR